MLEDLTEGNHWQRLHQQERDEGLPSDGPAKNTKQVRPLIMDPPICDEQEWHRF